MVVAEHLKAKPDLANPAPHGRAGPCDLTKARPTADDAKEVSQPDTSPATRGGSPSTKNAKIVERLFERSHSDA